MNRIELLGRDVEIMNAREVEAYGKFFFWLGPVALLIEFVFAGVGIWAGWLAGAAIKGHLLEAPGFPGPAWSVYFYSFSVGVGVCTLIFAFVNYFLHKHVYGPHNRLAPLNDAEIDEALLLSTQHEELERYRVAVVGERGVFIRRDLEVMRIVAEQILKNAEELRLSNAKRQLMAVEASD